jgi:hypothetical protein
MTMNSRHALGLMTASAVAALVASAFAQDAGRPRSADSADALPTSSAPNKPGADTLGAWPTSGPIVDPALKQLAAEEMAVARQADALIRQLEAAESDARRKEIKAKLSEALGKQFDVRQKRHGLEIEVLEAQVKKLKELVQKRQENRTEIISRRLDQAVRDSEGLGF